MVHEAFVVGVDTHLVMHGNPVRMLYAVVEETPEKAIEAVRAKVSATCVVDGRVAGTLTHDTVLKLGLRHGHIRKL